ncbi:Cationic amino acid transporter, putative [Pediculus humanus corporis]|uniref:Cationic amino acid transporter, putative n=1 Tax=Pediculus humanus subsp. corporis TaxID=121224 RepID=E0VFX8_PEDHC|nr:Cationic amino acid transporter, putative [Pediculus humanus corporis]EEB12284.1 Cationic amino acid transporter, putative [Pediculus humanus corporis]
MVITFEIMERYKKSKILNSFINLIELGIGNSVGVGIYVLLGYVTKEIVGPPAFISIFLSGFAAILTGLCLSEFQVKFFKADSSYFYSYCNHGENISFVYGWALILQYLAGSASVAKGIFTFIDAILNNHFSGFLKGIVPMNPNYGSLYIDLFSPIFIIIITILMSCGWKDYGIVRRIFTICNLLLLVTVIINGTTKANLKNWYLYEDNFNIKLLIDKNFIPYGLLGILKGAALSYYGFVGFEMIGNTGKEIKTPQKSIPLGIQGTILVTLIIFASSSIVLTLTSPYYENNVGAALPFAFEKMKWIIAVGSGFGFYTSLIGVTFKLPKIIRSMANDELLFRFLARKYFKREIPIPAILFGGLLTILAGGFFTFHILVSLTVFTALFISLIIAFDVILLRYVKKDNWDIARDDKKRKRVENFEIKITLKTLLKNFFYYNSHNPTKLTERIVVINLIILCGSSIGFSIFFGLFSNFLIKGKMDVLIPFAIFLFLILITIASISFQPKYLEQIPFKVPLIPLIPCLTIVINILFMVLLDSLPKIFFVIWMAIGILPHFLWYRYKNRRKDVGKNSVYQINRSNALKLSESIWKIKTEKKAFYEGAVNPVFENDHVNQNNNDDGEEEEENKKKNKTMVNDEFQTASTKISEKKTSKKEKSKKEIQQHSPVKDETVQWECVAEIHTEEEEEEKEFPQDNYELQVVDITYNFLTCIIDEGSLKTNNNNNLTDEDANFVSSEENNKKDGKPEEVILDDDKNDDKLTEMKEGEENNNNFYKRNKNERDAVNSNLIKIIESKICKDKSKLYDEDEVVLRKSNKGGGGNGGGDDDINNNSILDKSNENNNDENEDVVKNFKEKLNRLLKSHISMNDTLKEAILRYRADEEMDWLENVVETTSSQYNIKTLNKSQIKNKLEFLLSKGPPKRASLRNSFNINVKEKNDDILFFILEKIETSENSSIISKGFQLFWKGKVDKLLPWKLT